MDRKKLSKVELEKDFLGRLQAQPNCEGVTEVTIKAGPRLGSQERWKIVDWKGEADDEAVENGLRAVYKQLDGTVGLTP